MSNSLIDHISVV